MGTWLQLASLRLGYGVLECPLHNPPVLLLRLLPGLILKTALLVIIPSSCATVIRNGLIYLHLTIFQIRQTPFELTEVEDPRFRSLLPQCSQDALDFHLISSCKRPLIWLSCILLH